MPLTRSACAIAASVKLLILAGSPDECRLGKGWERVGKVGWKVVSSKEGRSYLLSMLEIQSIVSITCQIFSYFADIFDNLRKKVTIVQEPTAILMNIHSLLGIQVYPKKPMLHQIYFEVLLRLQLTMFSLLGE